MNKERRLFNQLNWKIKVNQPRTFWVRVARMMISVRIGVTLTSTPEYPSSANSRVKTSFSSAKNTPSATNWNKIEQKTQSLQDKTGQIKKFWVLTFLFLLIWVAIFKKRLERERWSCLGKIWDTRREAPVLRAF